MYQDIFTYASGLSKYSFTLKQLYMIQSCYINQRKNPTKTVFVLPFLLFYFMLN